MRRLPEPPLGLVVFVVGVSILGAEIAAARLLAPYFGASTIVWANTIGIVLVALSIGYWYGGKLADRNPTRSGLYRIVGLAGVLLAVLPFVADPILGLAVDALDSISAGAFVGSLLAVTVLVAVPILVSGAVAPYALRLAVADVAQAGTVSGRLYAISTVGSLLGRSCRRSSSSRSSARGGRSSSSASRSSCSTWPVSPAGACCSRRPCSSSRWRCRWGR